MNTDLISVIVPIYKVESYLDRCVSSIAAQTYQNLQIILVDDGSPDRCGAMCDAWAEKDRRITVIHKENGGLSDARNAGLAIAAGEYISFIDSDDWIEPDFLLQLYQALQTHNAQVAACGTAYVDEQDNILRLRAVAPVPVMDMLQALHRLVNENGVYQTVWNKLYHRSVIDGILFEKGKCHEDDFWTYQVFQRIHALAMVDQPLYNYLQRSSSIMGGGYNLKRLDSLQARYLRTKALQAYPSLASMSRQVFGFTCLWNLQNILLLPGSPERKDAVAAVLQLLRAVPTVPFGKLETKLVHRIRYAMFIAAPIFTARLHNLLGIGI